MKKIMQNMDLLYNVCHIPMALLQEDGTVQACWPPEHKDAWGPGIGKIVIDDFRLQKRDSLHPLINFLGSGYLLGVMELKPALYGLIGLVPSHSQSRKDLLAMLADVVYPGHLQSFCDFLLQQQLMTMFQLKDYMCLASRLLLGRELSQDDILFMDILTERVTESPALEPNLFAQREEAEFHIPVNFEEGICGAIEEGNRVRLERCLYSPTQGRVGRMSSSELRQQKYAFICMATLASRAAIRGGLQAETSFSLSDLYCQRADLLSEPHLIENLTYTMLVDYCDRVCQIQQRPKVSPVIESCISYISVHLHEAISLDQLSEHCRLCGRSLSMRFKAEMGIGITDYIHREKMQEAEYLLLHSGYSISEITSFLNYPSQSYFTQIFRRFYGQTPMQYRNRNQKS